MSVIASVKHRTASAQALGASWEYSPISADGPIIIARIVLGARIHDIDVPVCGSSLPIPGRWIIRPLRSRETWMLDCWMPFPPARIPKLHPFKDGMPLGSVELLACPPEIADELARL